ncbi:hypothetical protein CASFOL_039200 [Castilleja foliolosa]|uniref:Toprim domain-containing protein n=1 Tax=Castilleja foliolosa TaxID=1961234 RepID=A0ABD3BHB3_9LAMI
MLLHLIEWVVSNSLNLRSLDKIDILKELLENVEHNHSSHAVVMFAAGVLRSVNRSGSSGFMHIKNYAEERIEIVARNLVVSRTEPGVNLLLQFIALAILSRSGSVSHRDPLLMSLALALLTKDAGAITVENLVWNYCRDVYSGHRQIRLMLVGRADNLIREIEESAFLMVLVFALGVTKHRLNSNKVNGETKVEISLRILVSFSCVEYFRRMRLPDYMDTIRAVIVSVQENESACVAYIESIPSYDDLINYIIITGFSNMPKSGYLWSTDEVQTARIIFYMRVIPTCVDQLPASVFKKNIWDIPMESCQICTFGFCSLHSSGKDPTPDERVLLKEQLVFFITYRDHWSLCNTISSRHDDDSDLWRNWDGELESCKKLLHLLLRLLTLVDIQALPTLMKLLAHLIIELPLNAQNSLLKQLYQQIADSDDVIRKPALVSWLLAYFAERMISGETLRRNSVMQKKTGHQIDIAFTYRRKGDLVSCKYRTITKSFGSEANTEKIFYGLDDIKEGSDIIIVLMYMGPDALRNVIETAELYPIKGVTSTYAKMNSVTKVKEPIVTITEESLGLEPLRNDYLHIRLPDQSVFLPTDRNENLTDRPKFVLSAGSLLAYFAERMISKETLLRNNVMQVVGDRKIIAFPYRQNGQLVGCKYRTVEKRCLNMKKVFYGLDDIAEADEIIIVEGEMDKLSVEEAGYYNCVSVPGGAPQTVSLKELPSIEKDTSFQYLWNCKDYFDKASRIILATDADIPGQALAKELARRLGKERCWRVSWPKKDEVSYFKDANEVLVNLGAEALRDAIDKAKLL